MKNAGHGRNNMYPTINMKATGMRIQQIMRQRNLTVKDVQKYLDLSSVQSIYHWLKGKSLPTVDNLYALSELFQIPMDAMIAGDRKYDRLFLDESFYTRMYTVYMIMWRAYGKNGRDCDRA